MKTLSRKHKLIELIRTLDEAMTSWDTRSTGGGPKLMPRQYHDGSYAELQHQLATMRDNPQTRQQWWHLNQRYRWGTTRQTTVTYRRTRKGPTPHLPPRTELLHINQIQQHHMRITIYQWAEGVDPNHVNAALDHLLDRMPPHHLRLPLDILYRALGQPPPSEQRIPA